MSTIQFSLYTGEDGRKVITAFVNGQLTVPADDTHPNFTNILAACQASVGGETIDSDKFLDLFDVAKAVTREFDRLGERVTVKDNQILFDGDPVTGPLEDQIMEFLNAGEDFAPLVAFYEKLSTNPLGNVREGLFTWIQGQKEEGNFTITPEGDILGYKAVAPRAPEWREGYETVYVPSRVSVQADVLNGEEVPVGKFIEQVPGDVVEMPRSRVLNEPSQSCGDGLHIGTWAYAKGFMHNGQVMLVKFSPRDIVSLPSSASSWKLRVCRYTVVEPVDAPLEAALYSVESTPPLDLGPDVDLTISAAEPTSEKLTDFTKLRNGDKIVDTDGEEGTVILVSAVGELHVAYVDYNYWLSPEDVTSAERPAGSVTTPQAASSGGRPGSRRDPATGRFVA